MEQSVKAGSLKLGIIVCRHCSRWIEEVDTEKVTTFYSCCSEPACTGAVRMEVSEAEAADW